MIFLKLHFFIDIVFIENKKVFLVFRIKVN